MTDRQIRNIKSSLLELLLVDSNVQNAVLVNSGAGSKVRKYIREIAKADSHAFIKVIEGNITPIVHGEKSFWFIKKDKNLFRTGDERLYFKTKPFLGYRCSDYRVDVGKDWILSFLTPSGIIEVKE